jgi:plastocyanin
MSMIGMRARLCAAAAVIALSTAAPPNIGAGHDAMVEVAASAATVTIDHHAFMPAALTITAGTTVTWKNADDTPHTVRGPNQAFASAALDNGDSFSYTFLTPGAFGYFCSLHPFMVGEIVVKPAGTSP